MKKTPWFPCSIKPVHNGWYEVVLDGYKELPELCQFSGGRWRRFANDSWGTATGIDRPGYSHLDIWRGVSK